MDKEKRRKIISYSIDGLLGLILVFLLATQIQMLVTGSRFPGVPRAYGYSFLYVATDSMVGERSDSLPVGTGIIVKKTSASSLHIGDVVTFFDRNIGAPNTHRLDEEPKLVEGVYHLHTKGDNVNSQMYSYDGESFTEEELVGVVVTHNDALGSILSYVSPTASGTAEALGNRGGGAWVFPVIVLLPLAGIAAISIASTVREAKKQHKEEEQEIALAMAEAGIDPSNEAEATKFAEKYRFKKEYREQLEKEKEKAKKKAMKSIKAEQRRATSHES